MVDQKITTKENFSMDKDIVLHPEYNVEEDFRKFWEMEYTTPHIELIRDHSLYCKKRSAAKKGDYVSVCDVDLPFISSELLSLSPAICRSSDAALEMKHLEIAYTRHMERFLLKMDGFMSSAWKMCNRLIQSLQKFLVLSRGTAYVIIGSSVATFAVLVGSFMHKFFHFPMNPKFYLIPTVTGALSFTTSLMTFTFMKQTTNDLTKDLRKEPRMLRDLIAVLHRGDWLDGEVEKLFPHGINKKLIFFGDVSCFKTKHEWKKYLCSKIIQSNIDNDKELLNNEDFLITVKLFVESPAAEIWWSRMRLIKLMEEISQKARERTAKQLLSCHEHVIYRTALYVYPVLIPWLVISRTPEELRVIFSILGGFLAALEVGNDGSEELVKLKKMYQSFEKDFKDIYKICEIPDGAEA